jgi:hypothetical protein
MTGCPFTILHSGRCFELRPSSSGTGRTRLAGGCAGAASPAPGKVDSMGWKPAGVAVTTGAIVEVVSIVIVSVLVSVTVLKILSAEHSQCFEEAIESSSGCGS